MVGAAVAVAVRLQLEIPLQSLVEISIALEMAAMVSL
jgi:hypothetical protein